MSKLTLLQKAKKIKKRVYTWNDTPSKDDIEIALAWANDEVSTTQVSKVYGTQGGSIYCKLANVLKHHLKTLNNQNT